MDDQNMQLWISFWLRKKDGALGIRRKQGSKACAESKKRGLERPYQFFVHEKDMATERLVKLSSTTRFNVASNAPSHWFQVLRSRRGEAIQYISLSKKTLWISHLRHSFLQWSHLNVDSTDLKCSDQADRKPARVVLCNLINSISNITLFDLIPQKHQRIEWIRNNRRTTKFCYKRTNITEGMKEMWFMAFTKSQKRILTLLEVLLSITSRPNAPWQDGSYQDV